MRISKLKTERPLIDGHDAGNLGLHLAAFKVEAQADRLPGGGQFAADDLNHADQDGLFNVGKFAQRTLFPIAAEKEVDDGRSKREIELQHRQVPPAVPGAPK